jgi:hypothetical protein
MQNSSPRGVLDKPLQSLSTMTTDDGLRVALGDNDHEPLQHSGRRPSFSMEQDDHTTDDEEPSEDESCLRRSARNHGTDRLHNVSFREEVSVAMTVCCLGASCTSELFKGQNVYLYYLTTYMHSKIQSLAFAGHLLPYSC